MKLDLTATYKRINNILYQNDVAIVKFHSTFIDLEEMTEQHIKYMERFIEMNVGWYEILQGEDKVIAPVTDVVINAIEYIDQEIIADVQCQLTTPIEAINVSIDLNENFNTTGSFNLNLQTSTEQSHDPNSSRLDQVRFWLQKGITTSAAIAEKIGGHPSYVSRLIKQAKEQK